MRGLLVALSVLGAVVTVVDTASAQYYYDRGYYPRHHRRHVERPVHCGPGLVGAHDNYGRPYCRRWYPTRGSECPPGYTLQSGHCKPYRGY